jgi:hypothetical protein
MLWLEAVRFFSVLFGLDNVNVPYMNECISWIGCNFIMIMGIGVQFD